MGNPLAQRLNAFTKLSTSDREALDRIVAQTVREFASRRDLVREGDRPRCVYVVLEGWACRYKQLPDGRRQIVALFLPGDLFDANVFLLQEMDHSIGTITAVRVAEIGRAAFDALLLESPRIAQALAINDLVTVAVQREWTVDIGQRNAYERLAHLFCELHTRLSVVDLTAEDAFDFPLTQTDLAEAMGMTTVHVNRTLRQLREDGLIEHRGKRLHILDLERLQAAAQFNPNYLHLDREGRKPGGND